MKEKKIKKWHLVFLGVLILTTVGLRLWQHYHWSDIKVNLKGQELNVLVADNYYQLHKGLGGRSSLGEYDGMLFIFPYSDQHGIVMRDMGFSIDVVWLLDGEVIDIASGLPLQPNTLEEELTRYIPRKEVNLVLELPAGWTEENSLKIGDYLTIVE